MTRRFALHGAGFVLCAKLGLYSVTGHVLAEAGACHDLVGTYLTKNFAKGASSDDFTSRSLIVLSGSGQASFTDSGEGRAGGLRSVYRRARLVALHRGQQAPRDHLGFHHADCRATQR
jgi:hypothetical protein